MGFWRTLAAHAATWTTWGGSGVGDEAAAFLRGELLTQLLAGGSCWTVPPWVWLNTAAHADVERLIEVAETSPPRRGEVREWGEARVAVVRDLLARAGDDQVAVRALQREVLVPLEQAVSGMPDLTPARLVGIAAAELGLLGS